MKILSDNRLIAWGTVAGSLLTAVSMAAAIVSYQVRLPCAAAEARAAVQDHEQRIRYVEGGLGQIRIELAEIKGDVKWIRARLGQDGGPAIEPAKPDLQASSNLKAKP